MKLVSTHIFFISAICTSFPSYADEVATNAAAINDLREIQIQYLRDATVSGDILRDYADTISLRAGSQAACENVASDKLPELADQNSDLLYAEVEPIISLLNQYTKDKASVPTKGALRNTFLRGFGEGCGHFSSAGDTSVNLALEALEYALLIQQEIERRKSLINQALAGSE